MLRLYGHGIVAFLSSRAAGRPALLLTVVGAAARGSLSNRCSFLRRGIVRATGVRAVRKGGPGGHGQATLPRRATLRAG